MSSQSVRRGLNVSQFLRELNDNPAMAPPIEGFPDINDHDMAMLTNTEFYDTELGQSTNFQPEPPKSDSDGSGSRSEDAGTAPVMDDFSMDFMTTGDFNFPDFPNNYTSPTLGSFSDSLGALPAIQPNPQSIYPNVPQHQHHNGYVPPAPRIGDKHKNDGLSPPRQLNFDEQARVAAEEDKRRRNTAASARFRIKKKQREQALEKSAKEMTDKVNSLENRISTLETENKWLRSIVIEKNGGNEELFTKLVQEFHSKNQANALTIGVEDSIELKAELSTEEKDAGDSSG